MVKNVNYLTGFCLTRIQLLDTISCLFFRFEFDNGAEGSSHIGDLCGIVAKITWDWLAFEEDTDQRDAAVLGEH